jgi:hypothetical protein
MTSTEEPGLGKYARAIEQIWSELLDRPVILSRRDWDLLSNWFERCIPLQLIREALQPHGRTVKKPPRTLSHVSTAVEDAWAVVLQGRIAPHADEVYPSNDMASALTHWQTRLSAEPDGSALHGLLDELLGRLASGDSPRVLDRILDERLNKAVPARILEEIERAVAEELSEFRGKMPPAALGRTRAHAIMDRLRSELDLPRLSGSQDAAK